MLNREPGAFAGFGLDRNGAAQILGDRAADRQSESDAFDERIGLVESFENPVQMLLRDALSGVVDEQFDLFAPLGELNKITDNKLITTYKPRS